MKVAVTPLTPKLMHQSTLSADCLMLKRRQKAGVYAAPVNARGKMLLCACRVHA